MSKLYIVPTPIGNLGDISVRCRKTLAEADFIAAEDTRVTLKLLNYLELKKALVSYYEHNKAESGPRIVARILAGETCVLVSDAGSPAISDPGEDLVRLCAEAGITVCAIPGPCAVITALSISGLPTGRFCFEGFLSINKKSRREHLAGLKDERRTMIFYEAPHKLVNTLEDLAGAFGAERRISLCRDEAARRGRPHDARRRRRALSRDAAEGRICPRRRRCGRSCGGSRHTGGRRRARTGADGRGPLQKGRRQAGREGDRHGAQRAL